MYFRCGDSNRVSTVRFPPRLPILARVDPGCDAASADQDLRQGFLAETLAGARSYAGWTRAEGQDAALAPRAGGWRWADGSALGRGSGRAAGGGRPGSTVLCRTSPTRCGRPAAAPAFPRA